MIETSVEALGRFELRSEPLPPWSDGPVGREGRDAVERGRANAADRLRRWLPSPVVDRLGGYFAEAGVHRNADAMPAAVPTFTLESFLSQLCETPRTVYAVGGDSASAQVELRTLGGPTDGTEFGEQTEPGSPRILFSPTRLSSGLSHGLSLGVRQFDRQFKEWAPIVDDIAAVASADIFTKLFVAGGRESVTDWHRDQSDVVVTMLAGAKQFDVAPATASDDGDWTIEVGAELRPGMALVLPRSRGHCATPRGEVSALLSIGIMRHADWSFRSVVPSHLGFTSAPRSVAAYRLMLRPHTPAAPMPARLDTQQRWRSRMPGGLIVIHEDSDVADIAAAGMRARLSGSAARVLFAIHGAGVMTTREVVEHASTAQARCEEILPSLVASDFIAPC